MGDYFSCFRTIDYDTGKLHVNSCFPVMEKKLEISKLQSSYIITCYSIVAIIFIPLAGYLSDRFGRKKVIIPALILTGIGGLIAGLASWKMDQAYSMILLGRILQGIGASGAMPIVLPLV